MPLLKLFGVLLTQPYSEGIDPVSLELSLDFNDLIPFPTLSAPFCKINYTFSFTLTKDATAKHKILSRVKWKKQPNP